MEGCPKLPMLSFPNKTSPNNGNLADRIKMLIATTYGENPSEFSKEVSDLEHLRAHSCIRPGGSDSSSSSSADSAKKYYCQLELLRRRFPKELMEREGLFDLSWSDAFLNVASGYSEIDYEMAAVLYNTGALHSQLGAKMERDSSEGMKVSCTHFQCAAWSFHAVPDRHPRQATQDLSPDLLAFLSQVCLAQAQECILEKSILDHRKPTIVAKVCAQVAEYYRAAHVHINYSNSVSSDSGQENIADCIGDKRCRFWSSVSHLYLGIQADEAQRMGERVARFQAAADQLEAAVKQSKTLDASGGAGLVDRGAIADAIQFANDVIVGKLENAKKENEFVFHEKVPDIASLEEPKGASLVKGIGFDPSDPEGPCGPDIFARLVPYSAHEAASLYSEEKAKLLRLICEEIDCKDSELAEFLSTLDLEEIPKPEENLSLPQELIECAAAMSVKGGDSGSGEGGEAAVQRLVDAMDRIASISGQVEGALAEIKDMLDREEEEEDSCASLVGGRRPTPINSDINAERRKLEEAHQVATDSNLALKGAVEMHLDQLRLLARPLDELQKEVPSMADLDEDSEACIAEVRRILDKVDEMKTQRLQLADQLRDAVHSDDITKRMVANGEEDEEKRQEFFASELKKFDPQVALLRQNMLAQENIVRALTEANANFAETRRVVADLLTARDTQVGRLVTSYEAFDDLLFKAAKGLEFYSKLEGNVSKLLDRTKGVVKVQQEERDARIAARMPPIGTAMPAINPAIPAAGVNPVIDPQAPMAPLAQYAPAEEGLEMTATAVPETTAAVPATAPLPAAAPLTQVTPKSHRLTLKEVMEQRKDLQQLTNQHGSHQAAPPASCPDIPATAPPMTPPTAAQPPQQQYNRHYQPQVRPQSTYGLPAQSAQSVASTFACTPPIATVASQAVPSYNPTSVHQTTPTPYSANMTASQIGTAYQPAQLQLQQFPIHHQQPAQSQHLPVAATTSLPFPTVTSTCVPATSQINQMPHPSLQGAPRPNQQTVYNPAQQPAMAGRPVPHVTSALPYPSNVVTPSSPQRVMGLQQEPFTPIIPSRPIAPYTPNLAQQQQQTGQMTAQPQGQRPAYQSSPPAAPVTTRAMQAPHGYLPMPSQTHYGQPAQSLRQPMPSQFPMQQQQSPVPYPHAGYPTSQTLHRMPGVTTGPHQGSTQAMQQAPPTSGISGQQQQPYPLPTLKQPQTHSQQRIGGPYPHYGVAGQVPPAITTTTAQSSLPYPANPQPPPPTVMSPTSGGYGGVAPNISTYSTYSGNQGVVQQTPLVSQPGGASLQRPLVRMPQQQMQQQPFPGMQPQRPQTQIRPMSLTNQQQQQQPTPAGMQELPLRHPSNPVRHPGTPMAAQQQPYHANQMMQQGPVPQSVNSQSGQPYPRQQMPPQNPYPPPAESPFKPLTVAPSPSPAPPQLQQGVGNTAPTGPQPQLQLHQPNYSSSDGNLHTPDTPSVANGSTPTPEFVKTHGRQSSVDDMLNELDGLSLGAPTASVVSDRSSSAVGTAPKTTAPLQPKVMTASDLAEQQRNAKASEDIVKASVDDPFSDAANLDRLKSEYEDLQALVENFAKDKTSFDAIWRDLNDRCRQSSFAPGTISVARCYIVKNRQQDVVPYDKNRVELPTTKDDYINASHVRGLGEHSPRVIATQAPLARTFADFWTMVAQEQVETIVCLLSESEMDDVYWPDDRQTPLTSGRTEITLQGVRSSGPAPGMATPPPCGQSSPVKVGEPRWTERTVTVRSSDTNVSRVAIHLQLGESAEAGGQQGFSTEAAVAMAQRVLELQRQQRSMSHPVLVHCLAGSGRTSLLLLLLSAMSEISVCGSSASDGRIIPDLVAVATKLCEQRKGVFADRDFLRQAYQGVAMYCRRLLVRHGALPPDHPAKVKQDNNVATPAPPSTAAAASHSSGSTDPLAALASFAHDGEPARNNQARRKTSKQEFSSPSGGMANRESDPNDPLSQLDPLWNLK